MNRVLDVVAFALAAALLSGTGTADVRDAAAAVERLFRAPAVEESWFAPEFLAQAPPGSVAAIVADIENRYGPLDGVAGDDDSLTVRLERAEVPAHVALDSSGRIAGLRFEAPVPTTGVAAQVEAIAALPGRASVLVASDGETVATHDPDAVLAVGSAAKLAILKAVADQVAAGRLAWDQVVRLDRDLRSLPHGILQDWPDEAPVTVATLANLMISQSDNTATDALVRLVGRESVEAITPRNTPFPTTRELFVLKADGALRSRWLSGDAAERRAVLDEADARPLPKAEDLDPSATGIEWFMSAGELCALLKATAALPSMSINSGLADSDVWSSVAYKGGSDTGVLNFSTWLVAEDGATHCVVATWNGEGQLDEARLAEPYRGMLYALREEKN
jgi:beta-lactamase class A